MSLDSASYNDRIDILNKISMRSANYNYIWDECRASDNVIEKYLELRCTIDKENPYFFGVLENGIKFAGDARDFPAALHAIDPYSNSTLINALIETIGNNYGDIIDIGANIGVVSSSIASHIGSRGHVYAFEPSPDTFEIAAATLALNNIKNTTLIRAAVSNTNSNCDFYATPGNSAISSLKQHEFAFLNQWKKIEVPVICIDRFFDALKNNIILIKIDVEGEEFNVLKGAKRLIHRLKPTIVYEYTPVAVQSHGWTDLDTVDFLGKCGIYHFEALIEARNGKYVPFPLNINEKSQVNVFARPMY